MSLTWHLIKTSLKFKYDRAKSKIKIVSYGIVQLDDIENRGGITS